MYILFANNNDNDNEYNYSKYEFIYHLDIYSIIY